MACWSAAASARCRETWGDLQRAAGASERLMELLHEVPAIARARPSAGAAGQARAARCRFENVTFRYPTRPDFAALNDFSLDVAPGEAVALVGPVGAGKSTVFQLMLRFFAPQNGAIRFDGVDIAELDPVELRREYRGGGAGAGDLFRHASPPTSRYGREGASDEEVRRAADAAAATEFIDKLPQRLRHAGGRARRDLVGRPAPAPGHRPRHPARCAAAAAGRGDQRAGCGE